MNTIMKFFFQVFLVPLLFFIIISTSVYADAQTGTCGENLTWNLSDSGILTISGSGDMYDYNYDPPWHNASTNVTSVVIEDSVTSIGDYAFYGCDFTDISIPDSIKHIGKNAFASCINLKSISIPDSVKTMESHTFVHCESLEAVSLPDDLDAIGDGMFYNCRALTSVAFPDTLKSIGNMSFYHCSSLTTLTLPDGMTRIDDNAFSECWGLTNIVLPNTVTRIGKHAFSCCYSLKEITLPNSIHCISDGMFSDCVELESIVIPKSVKSIGNSVFYRCLKLSDIEIPEGVETIGSSTFFNTPKLDNITFPSTITSIGQFALSFDIDGEHFYIPTPEKIDVYFKGDAPELAPDMFYHRNNVTVYYPKGNVTWTNSILDNDYQANSITWNEWTYGDETQPPAQYDPVPDDSDSNLSKPVAPQKETAKVTPSAPNTGDASSLTLWFTILCTVILIMVATDGQKKKSE